MYNIKGKDFKVKKLNNLVFLCQFCQWPLASLSLEAQAPMG